MKVLLIEDEPVLAKDIVAYLSEQGCVCDTAGTLAEAEERLHLYEYDIVLLDLMLPDGDGSRVLRMVRSGIQRPGFIVVSAKNSLADKVHGLDLGADDYLTKPFHPAELFSRMHALFRRRTHPGEEVLRLGDLIVEVRARRVTVHGHQVALTPKEYQLLLYFLINRGRVLSKTAIADHLYSDACDTADSLDVVYVHVNNLRNKLARHGVTDFIHTEYGSGYRLTQL